MKKGLLIALMLTISAAFNAKAQILIGGNIGIGNAPDGGISLYVAPDVSYRLNNNFVAGGQLYYRTGYDRVGVTPYARWHILPIGSSAFSIFLSATAPCEFYGGGSTVSIRLRPGLTLRINDNVYLVANVGYTGYSWSFSNGKVVSSGWYSQFNGDSINIGFCFAI